MAATGSVSGSRAVARVVLAGKLPSYRAADREWLVDSRILFLKLCSLVTGSLVIFSYHRSSTPLISLTVYLDLI